MKRRYLLILVFLLAGGLVNEVVEILLHRPPDGRLDESMRIPHGSFAVRTLFYSALLWLLILGPFTLRRFLRVRRGRCAKCGYPIGESGVCSECGTELPRRARAT